MSALPKINSIPPQILAHSQAMPHPKDVFEAVERHLQKRVVRANHFSNWAQDHEKFNLSDACQNNFDRLHSKKAIVVLSAHQPCLGLGPAFIFYKIIQSISIASWLQAQGHMAIPVFICSSEDHDLGEILQAWRINDEGQLHSLQAQVHQQLRAIEVLSWNPTLQTLSKKAIPAHWHQLNSIHEERYCDVWISMLYQIFGAYGLLIAEPKSLPATEASFWQKLEEHKNTLPDTMKLMRLNTLTGIRESLQYEQGAWSTKQSHQRKPLLDWDGPNYRLSPNYLLRPLWAAHHLPAAISVLGPSEYQYHLSILKYYADFNLPKPILWPRFHATQIPLPYQTSFHLDTMRDHQVLQFKGSLSKQSDQSLRTWIRPRSDFQERSLSGLSLFPNLSAIQHMLSHHNPFDPQHKVFVT